MPSSPGFWTRTVASVTSSPAARARATARAEPDELHPVELDLARARVAIAASSCSLVRHSGTSAGTAGGVQRDGVMPEPMRGVAATTAPVHDARGPRVDRGQRARSTSARRSSLSSETGRCRPGARPPQSSAPSAKRRAAERAELVAQQLARRARRRARARAALALRRRGAESRPRGRDARTTSGCAGRTRHDEVDRDPAERHRAGFASPRSPAVVIRGSGRSYPHAVARAHPREIRTRPPEAQLEAVDARARPRRSVRLARLRLRVGRRRTPRPSPRRGTIAAARGPLLASAAPSRPSSADAGRPSGACVRASAARPPVHGRPSSARTTVAVPWATSATRPRNTPRCCGNRPSTSVW